MAPLIDSRVTANTADTNGGGIFNVGTLTLTRSMLGHNTAGAQGGGIYNDGTAQLRGSRVVANTPDNCFPPGTVPGCTG
ncbi:hypothetical protein AB0N17_45065 [Streptomyces sp. NPDC051133]|uniref:hypothetical protein n=1 Tax=Streptomyces sp. NPDC051133 TaxID=3155521 RepID=UPI003419E619